MISNEILYDNQRNLSLNCKKCKEKQEKMTVLEIEIDLKSQENEELRLQSSELLKRLRHIEVELEDLKNLPQQTDKVLLFVICSKVLFYV